MEATIRINKKTQGHVATLERLGYEVNMGTITRISRKTQKTYDADVAIVEITGFVPSDQNTPIDISTKERMMSVCKATTMAKQAFSYQSFFRMPGGDIQKAGAHGFAVLVQMGELSCLVMSAPEIKSTPTESTPAPANLVDELMEMG